MRPRGTKAFRQKNLDKVRFGLRSISRHRKMVFNSLSFLIFFPIVVSLYYVFPKKIQPFWLLAASYYFYMSWNAKYAILILFSTVVTYLTGIFIGKFKFASENQSSKTKYAKIFVFVCFLINLGLLFFFKYYHFFFDNLTKLFSLIGINLSSPFLDVILPVGVSFYTFQALGYCVDVYRGTIKAETNFFRYALFVSFFPQLVAGPIERSGNLLNQLENPKPFTYNRFLEGILLMLWGFFQKLVIADRIAIFVDKTYGDYSTYPGTFLVVATILFSFQIYCDFGGYSNIARGAALILGIDLMNNFISPYLSKNCGEFWRRWHISLSSWFRDYLYIPLGGNRKGKIRKYLNLIVVFGLSGLWHGANWTYIIWGLVNGIFQIIGDLLKKPKEILYSLAGIHKNKFGTDLAKITVTYILIDFSWIFFRAKDIHHANEIIKSIFTVFNPEILFNDALYNCGLTRREFSILIFSIMILLFVDILNKKGIELRRKVLDQDYWFRVVVFCVSICFILIFGLWGTGYRSDAFLYFQF